MSRSSSWRGVRRVRRFGFTLVELLVVIAIIGVLVALLLPAVQAAREAARRSQCSNNLKQYGLGIHNYEDTFKTFPINAGGPAGNFLPRVTWQIRILPYMEQKNVYDGINWAGGPTTPGDPRREPLLGGGPVLWAVSPPYTHCPSDPYIKVIIPGGPNTARAQCNYGGSLGSQNVNGVTQTTCHPFTAFEQLMTGGNPRFGEFGTNPNNVIDKSRVSGIFAFSAVVIRIADVTDGTSNTLMVGEVLPGCQWINGTDAQPGTWINSWGNLYSIGGGVSTIAPMNEMTTCPRSNKISDPACNPAGGHTMQYAYGFKSLHPNGAQFTLADGSVRFISQTINHATVYQHLGRRDDGNVIGDF
jgi:prepilin-type N-terminal cleavage/methylation domain-containing protein